MRSRVFSSIRDVPREDLHRLLDGASQAWSPEFWEVVEQSGLNDFRYHHALFYDEAGRAVALASFYSITTDIAIFASGPLRSALTAIRRLFPNFLKLRMLECGTPITLGAPPLSADASLSAADVVAEVSRLLIGMARAGGQLLIVVRDFERGNEQQLAAFGRLGYHCVDSLPNTYLDIAWATSEDYIASLTSYYRSKLQKHLRRNREQGVRHELVDDFGALADTLCAQWRVVHGQADEFQREVLTPGFYRKFSAMLGPRSKAILFRRGEELVGHALLMLDGTLLRWLYFGRNEAVNDSLYIYVGYAVIDAAIALGAKRIEMGLTTYPIKQDLGAEITPIRFAIRSPYAIVNAVVGHGYRLMNHPPKLHNRRVFKQAVVEEASGRRGRRSAARPASSKAAAQANLTPPR